jgi:transcriptional regulator with XRE-family HTH domain
MSRGQRIQSVRIEAGFKKALHLAKAVGVSGATVSEWENDIIKKISGENLLKLSKVLNVTSDWLETGKGPKHPIDQNIDSSVSTSEVIQIEKHLSPQDEKLLHQFKGLPKRERKRIRAEIEHLSEQYKEAYEEMRKRDE